MMPAVSVCIPVHNGERFLPATLRSVLSQRDVDYEVVVIENASTDATPEILASCRDRRLRVVRTSRLLSLGENWRFGMTHLRAPLIKLVCADDLIRPTCLSEQAALLTNNPGLALVACRRDLVDANGRPLVTGQGLGGLLGRRSGRDVARCVARSGINPIGESAAVMFRKADYAAVGGWDTRRIFPMDIDLWLRLLTRGDMYGQRETLAAFRLSPVGLSAAHSARQYRECFEFVAETCRQWQVPAAERWMGGVVQPLGWWAWAVRARAFDIKTRLDRPDRRKPARVK